MKMQSTNRFALSALAVLATIACSSAAGAQSYPTRPIQVIVPFAGGSASDVVTRILLDRASKARSEGLRFAQLNATEQREFVNLMRQNKIDGWQGPPGGFIYFVMRHDAVDVVYGTREGYESLGIPYMPHIAPEKRW